MREAPDSGVGRTMRGAARERALQSAKEKPWAAYLSTSLGRNSNVTALSDDIIQPADISNRDSPFYSIDAGAQYLVPDFLNGTLTLGYDLSYQEFWELREFDTFENALSARYSYALYSDIHARLLLRGAHARVDNERFRNSYTVRPSLLMRPRHDLEVEPFYSYAGSDYPRPTTTPALLDRDSNLQNIGARVAWAIPDTPAVAELGFARMHNDAEGNDYSYRGMQYWVRIAASLPAQIDAELQWTVANYDYTNLNSLAPTSPPGPTAFGFKRADDSDQFTLRLSRPIIPGLSAFFLFNYMNMDSNLSVFDYHQAEGRLGLLARF